MNKLFLAFALTTLTPIGLEAAAAGRAPGENGKDHGCHDDVDEAKKAARRAAKALYRVGTLSDGDLSDGALEELENRRRAAKAADEERKRTDPAYRAHVGRREFQANMRELRGQEQDQQAQRRWDATKRRANEAYRVRRAAIRAARAAGAEIPHAESSDYSSSSDEGNESN